MMQESAPCSIEMDEMIMESSTQKTGAAAAKRKTENPLSLARKNMEKTEHVMIIGENERLRPHTSKRGESQRSSRKSDETHEAEGGGHTGKTTIDPKGETSHQHTTKRMDKD